MDIMTPPMFNVSKIDLWKVRMCVHLKALGLHVYLPATKESYLHVYLPATKESYLGNSKHKKTNAQALKALKKIS